MRIILASLVSALLVACVAHQQFTPVTVPAPANAFAKAGRVLMDRGATIETKDEAAGLIVTKWEEQSGMGSTTRLRWSVTIENATVTVRSQCGTKLDSSGPMSQSAWEDCGAQPGDRNEQAKAIADAIRQ